MTKQVHLADVCLNVFDEGEGETILFVHGFPLDHTMWRHQLAEFQQTHRVIAPDLRGFGESTATPGTVTMEQFADDLADLLDHMNVSQPVHLCGLSMGGYVAWQFWKRHPARLTSLILCDTRAIADSPEAKLARIESAEKVLREGPQFLAESMPEKLFAETTRKNRADLIERTQQVIRATSAAGISAALEGMAVRADVTDWLKRINLPALVIVGAEDQISTVDEMNAIAHLLPSAGFVEIPDSGHLAPLESPETVNQAIREFLRTPRSPGATSE